MPMSGGAPPASVGTAGGVVTVTGIGLQPVLAGQTTIVWLPAVGGAVQFELPPFPLTNEQHTFKSRCSTGVPMQVSANTNQTIDGMPYWVGVNLNDRLSVLWAGGGLWIVVG